MKTQYIGTYTAAELKDSKLRELITSLQDKEHMRKMKYVNHREINNGNQTEVWLSDTENEYTVSPKC